MFLWKTKKDTLAHLLEGFGNSLEPAAVMVMPVVSLLLSREEVEDDVNISRSFVRVNAVGSCILRNGVENPIGISRRENVVQVTDRVLASVVITTEGAASLDPAVQAGAGAWEVAGGRGLGRWVVGGLDMLQRRSKGKL